MGHPAVRKGAGIVASLTIRKLDDEVKSRLRARASGNGRSMAAEARAILREAVAPGPNEDGAPAAAGRRREDRTARERREDCFRAMSEYPLRMNLSWEELRGLTRES